MPAVYIGPVKLRLGEEATEAGLTVAFRHRNGDERISARFTAGADWRDVTLDRAVARRFREWVVVLGARAGRDDAIERISVERRADEPRVVGWGEPFVLEAHQVVTAPDGTRLAASEIGPRRAALLVDGGDDRDEVEIGEGGFARWRGCMIHRDPAGALTLAPATATRPLVYGAPLELALGETAAHDDGTRLHVTTVARLSPHEHIVAVEIARGRLRRSLRLRRGDPGAVALSERYTLALDRYRSDRRAALLRVDKEEALPVGDGRFTLALGRPVRRADGLFVSHQGASHIHWVAPDGGDGGTTGYFELEIGPAGDPSPLRIERTDGGEVLGRATWRALQVTIHAQTPDGLTVEIAGAPPPPAPEPLPEPPSRPWWRFWR